jgi:hypothetical protein
MSKSVGAGIVTLRARARIGEGEASLNERAIDGG